MKELIEKIAKEIDENKKFFLTKNWREQKYSCEYPGCKSRKTGEPFEATPKSYKTRNGNKIALMWITEDGRILCEYHEKIYTKRTNGKTAPLHRVLNAYSLALKLKDPLENRIQKIIEKNTTCVITGDVIRFSEAYAVNPRAINEILTEDREDERRMADVLREHVVEQKKDENGYSRFICKEIADEAKKVLGEKTKNGLFVFLSARSTIKIVEQKKEAQAEIERQKKRALATINQHLVAKKKQVNKRTSEETKPPKMKKNRQEALNEVMDKYTPPKKTPSTPPKPPRKKRKVMEDISPVEGGSEEGFTNNPFSDIKLRN